MKTVYRLSVVLLAFIMLCFGSLSAYAENDAPSFAEPESPEVPEEYKEFLRRGNWVSDLFLTGLDYEELPFLPIQWCVYDLDGDDTPELIVQYNSIWLIYTCSNGQIIFVGSGAMVWDMAVLVSPELGIIHIKGEYMDWSFSFFAMTGNETEQDRPEGEEEGPNRENDAEDEADPPPAGTCMEPEQKGISALKPFA